MQNLKKYILIKILIKIIKLIIAMDILGLHQNGSIQFAISEEKAQFILEKKLEEKQ